MNQTLIRWRPLLLVTLFVVLVSGNAAALGQADPAAQDMQARPVGEFVPGEILVGVRGDAVRAASALATTGVRSVLVVEECEPDEITVAAIGERVTPHLLAVAEGSELETIAQLAANPDVAYAEPNWLVYAAAEDLIETQPEIPAQVEGSAAAQPETPYQVNDPSYAERQWYLQRINASRAWSLAYGQGGLAADAATIQVAVVDSGIDTEHPEFSGRLLGGKNYVAPNTEPRDRYGHGTHVAGLIGAVINNGQGVAGVTANVKIDPRKVLNDMGSGTIDNVARGICEAADAGAKIINLSLETAQRSQTMLQAVKYARARGALLIAASGNSGLQSVAYPAGFDEVMAVAATTYNDQRASYSNYSSTAPIIEIAAPGGTAQQSMYNTWAKGAYCRDVRAVLQESGFCTSEGTSMAAAVVTGAAALLWSLDQDLTADEVRSLLRESAAPIDESPNEVGSGRLDLHAAVRRLVPPGLTLSQTRILYERSDGDSPHTTTIRLDNPSGEPINYEAGLVGEPPWLHLLGADNEGRVQGTARYGEPAYLSFVISPTTPISGLQRATAQITGTRGSQVVTQQQVAVELLASQLDAQSYLPLVVQTMGGTIPPLTTSWEQPNVAGRTLITLTNDSEFFVTLPFTFTLGNQPYTGIKVNANGFVSFEESLLNDDSQNVCLPNNDAIGAAIYGWWTDLDPSAAGAQVSTFRPAADRFVIEFANVPTAARVAEEYTVSFQIVLFRNGTIGLNYGEIPEVQAQLPPVTIGVEARDGRFHNQIACRDADRVLGDLPEPQQSFLLRKESIY
jgi:subtilisin family serine protease